MKRWLTLVPVLLLGGCVHYTPQPLLPEQSASQLAARRLDDPGVQDFLQKSLPEKLEQWPLRQWDLEQLTLAAFYFHPTLEVARDQWLAARAGEKTAAARLNPSVTVNPSYDSGIPGNYSPWIVPVTFDVPIETAGKRGKRMAEAVKVAESARWNFVSAAWQVRGGVRSALQAVKIAERRHSILAEQVSVQTKMLKLLKQRYEVGEISQPELISAEIAFNRSQLDLAATDAALADARSHFAESLGVPREAIYGLRTRFDFSPGPRTKKDVAAARDLALRGRADILAALADYAAAEADLSLQIARQYPDLHLGPGYAWNNGNAGDNQWSLGLTLELPILDQNQGPIAEAKARRQLQAAKFLALQSQIIAQIDRALAGWEAARIQQRFNQAEMDAARRQLKAVQDQAKAGSAEPLEVLNAQLEFCFAELAGIDGDNLLATAVGDLEDALQQPEPTVAKAVETISAMTASEGKVQP
jgi:outer membrane protein TolC